MEVRQGEMVSTCLVLGSTSDGSTRLFPVSCNDTTRVWVGGDSGGMGMGDALIRMMWIDGQCSSTL